eukprot:gene1263-6594_t
MFPPGQFELSQQVWLPPNVIIEGASDPNDPTDRRKRPLVVTNTVVRNANVQGQLLVSFSGGSDLCGFGLFELPGCIPTFSAKGAS